jgi:Leucine-rich repeat (LRR) protein
MWCFKLRGIVCILLLSCCVKSAQAQLLDSLSLDTTTAFTSLEEALKQPENVIKLSLRKKKLKVFPPEIFKFPNLQYLDLSKNDIEELPSEIGDLKNLQFLILSKNALTTVPSEIGRLKNLRWLNINQNAIAMFPPQIGDLDNLEYFDLWSNELTDLPDAMSNLKKLKVLDLRVIIISDEKQKEIKEMFPPTTTVYFSPSCNCGH